MTVAVSHVGRREVNGDWRRQGISHFGGRERKFDFAFFENPAWKITVNRIIVPWWLFAWGGWLLAMAGDTSATEVHFEVRPRMVALHSPEAYQQMVVLRKNANGDSDDWTRRVHLNVGHPDIVSIDSLGCVRALRNGATEISIDTSLGPLRVPVTVSGMKDPPPLSFVNDVVPVLNKYGCNTGQCHAKAEGQNGFKLSVFAADQETDYLALTHDIYSRRILSVAPAHSLMLLKATTQITHGGGQRFAKGSLPYRQLYRWIAEGAPYQNVAQQEIERIEVDPEKSVVLAGQKRQIRVSAIDTAGVRRCVTLAAEYKSNATEIATIDAQGLVQTTGVPGEVAILVKYGENISACRLTIPQEGPAITRPAEHNFVDHHVWNKLERLNLPPSRLSDDGPFLRRLYLDVLGVLPTSREATRFLADQARDKRARVIDEVLERSEYVDYWAMLWSDLLRVDRAKMQPAGVLAMTRWLREQFRQNRRYDDFVRDILTAKGHAQIDSPVGLYQVIDSPEILSRSVSQLFLGVRIECAQCHHHPFEKWSQTDYFALASFFTGVAKKDVSNIGQVVYETRGEDFKHPGTGELVPMRALGTSIGALERNTTRRTVLADWMTAPGNPYFSRMIANRLWAHYMGRGLVEPIDDIRETNPATNVPLLDALAEHMVQVGYDLKAFTRVLLNSRTYQLSSKTNEANASDGQNFSHAMVKVMPAEVLLDAISQATGVPEKFNGWPEGYRATQIWDNLMSSYFLESFGRPQRITVCSCERSTQPSISQALHLMNSGEINKKISSYRGRARQLSDSPELSPDQIIDELFLVVLSRKPNDEEKRVVLQAFGLPDKTRRTATEDVLWALLNTKEFIYVH